MKKVLNFRLSVLICLSLCVGIVLTFLYYAKSFIAFTVVAILFLCALSLYVFLPLKRDRANFKPRLIFALVFFLFATLGGLNLLITTENYRNADLGDNFLDIKGRVVESYQNDIGGSVILSDVEVNGKIKGKINYKISVYLSGENNLDIGDIITFSTTLYDNDIFYEGRFSASDIGDGIKYFAYLNSNEITLIGNHTTLFENVNLYMRDVLQKGLDKDSFSVAYAMLTGNASYMEYNTLKNFRDAGVAHIFAVSGLHIGVLATALTFLFKRLKVKNAIRVMLTSIILFLYSGVCGFSSSSLRAFVMCTVLLSCECLGSKYDPLSAIGVAGALILGVKSTELFSVGFQLSFAVVIGIVTLAKPIAKLLKFLPKKLSSAIGTATSAQLFSIPICLYAFGQFSTISVFMNVLFLPVASAIFIFLLICTILAGVTTLYSVILFPANYLLKTMIFLINLFDYEAFLVGGFVMGIFSLGFYLTWLVVAGIFNVKGLLKTVFIISLCIITVVGTLALNIIKNNQPKMHIIGSDKICATEFFDSEENNLVISDFSDNFSLKRFERLKQYHGIKVIDNLIVMNSDNRGDIHTLITRLLTVFDIKNIVYYGEKDEVLEVAVNSSLNGINISNAMDNLIVSSKNSKCRFLRDGLLLEYVISGQKVAVFGRIGGSPFEFSGLEKYVAIIAVDYLERLDTKTECENVISYRATDSYPNGERQGNFIYKFK